MGRFEFPPEFGQTYKLVIENPAGIDPRARAETLAPDFPENPLNLAETHLKWRQRAETEKDGQNVERVENSTDLIVHGGDTCGVGASTGIGDVLVLIEILLRRLVRCVRRERGEIRELGEIGGKELALVDAAMADVAVEVAIGAFRQAERPVDVNPEGFLFAVSQGRSPPA